MFVALDGAANLWNPFRYVQGFWFTLFKLLDYSPAYKTLHNLAISFLYIVIIACLDHSSNLPNIWWKKKKKSVIFVIYILTYLF